MRRWSFLVMLVRLALEKYKDMQRSMSPGQMLKRLLHDFVLKQNRCEPWQKMREMYFWTLEVDDLLSANEGYLQAIFDKYGSDRRLEYSNCLVIFTSALTNGLSLESAKYCYGMSKMTEVVDLEPHNYLGMRFVEFLEMVCRAADIKFRNTEVEQRELHEKIGYLLDELLLCILGIEKKNEPESAVIEISDSDDDY